jgi:hypothetical protein
MLSTDTSTNITAAVFAAYLKCPTKAYLMLGRHAPTHLGLVQI